MEGASFKGHRVWPYASMLYSRSPLLQEIYCESHRLEPWSVYGHQTRYGHYPYPRVLYVPEAERAALLAAIPERLLDGPDYAAEVIARHQAAAKRLLGLLGRARRGVVDRWLADELIEETCRVLAAGVFKEALEPAALGALLAEIMPVQALGARLLALYQPLGLPHFIQFELRMLFYARRHAEDPDPRWIDRAIERCAHLSRFLLEEPPLAQRDRMAAELEQRGREPQALAAERRQRLEGHRSAVASSLEAERDLLAELDRAGRYTLHTKMTVAALVEFVQFVATFEELKHVLAVEAAKVLRRTIAAAGLPLESVDRERLLAALSPSA
jgi:hypothetical protein